MADKISKIKRSQNMSLIRSRGNSTTELKLLSLLRENKIVGWRRHNKKLPGTPDFSFPNKKVAIFVDGCFWHGCKKCYSIPKSNKKFWKQKLENNILRDVRNKKAIKKLGWIHMRLWEHELVKTPGKSIVRVLKVLNR